MTAPGPTGEWQKHLGVAQAFAGPGQRRRMFRVLDVAGFLLNAQILVRKERKPRTKQFDDDENHSQCWQAVTSTPTSGPQGSASHPDGRVLAEIRVQAVVGVE